MNSTETKAPAEPSDVDLYYKVVSSHDEQDALEATSQITGEVFLKRIAQSNPGFTVRIMAVKKINNIPFLESIKTAGGNLSPWIKMRIDQLQTFRTAA